MVRKRAASDMELQTPAGDYHHRLLRRPQPANPLDIVGFSGLSSSSQATAAQNDNNNVNRLAAGADHPPNYSTMTLPSSSSAHLMSLSTTTCSTNNIDSHSSATLKTNPPPLCVFSGLPLFPPDKSYHHLSNLSSVNPTVAGVVPSSNSSSTIVNPNAGMAFLTGGGSNSTGMPADDSMSATAWIDNIIKDLIHSSTDVSIPHLIQNVREIIHPCNPNLATLLEYRLRSLMDLPPELVEQQSVHNPAETFRSRVQVRGKDAQTQLRNNPAIDGMFPLPPADLQHLDWTGDDYNTTGGPPPAAVLPSSNNEPQQQLHESPPPHPPSATDQSTATASAQAAAMALREKKREELRQQKRDEEGLHLLTLLLQCAEAVSDDNFDEANKMLLEISELSTPYGTAAQRVAAYFSEAMSARLTTSYLGIYTTLPPNAAGSLGLKKITKREAVAVHWLQHSLYDVTGSDTNTLWFLQRLAPKVVTVVEQDLSHAGSFLGRFVEAIHYYSALFDSLGSSYGEESEERHVVEQQLLSKEIRNVLSIGGPSRTGEVKFNNWREKLEQCGFKGISLAGNAAAQATLLLGMFPSNGYTLVEDKGTLKLGWKDLCLLTASAWRP
ncbi:hypothetical protein E3N88_33667 [Mikania micrantha]|uniref:Uncharacterized protein n=1 Tax=Mikania micrantha TaxID=192012 RepID=A0A5N6MCL1_9ASTR|nr:hypothetical protein E3N88_33667 [Mikania micrantha]